MTRQKIYILTSWQLNVAFRIRQLFPSIYGRIWPLTYFPFSCYSATRFLVVQITKEVGGGGEEQSSPEASLLQ